MTAPTFLICGAMKAGTTALAAILQQHPDIFIPAEKEPAFFLKEAIAEGLIHVPNRWVRHEALSSPRSLKGYRDLFAAASAKARGEASTMYMAHSEIAAPAIAETFPNIKLIFILRHPIFRAISAYNYTRLRKLEPARHLETALADELAGKRDNWLGQWRYIHTSQYATLLAPFISRFPRENLYITTYDKFRDAPEIFLREACEFLRVEPSFSFDTSKKYNMSGSFQNPFRQKLFDISMQPTPFKAALRSVMPKQVRTSLVRRFFDEGRANQRRCPEPPSRGALITLENTLGLQVRDIESVTGLDLSDWRENA